MFEESSYVYCLWYVPFRGGDSFFAAMIHDEEGDRIVYRFDEQSTKSYYMMERGIRTIEDFKRRFNRTVEEFSDATSSPMEYLPVESGVERALEILEEQPWGMQILPD